MDKEVGVVVVLPQEYNKDPEKRYPVLYTLHGKGAPYQTWSRMSPLQEALRDKPMIVTCFDGDEASYYIDAAEKKDSKYTTFFFEEFIPYIDNHYRTLPEPGYRAVTGFSLGGFGAFHYMLEKPDMFSSVSALSGYFPRLTDRKTVMDSRFLPLLMGDFDKNHEKYARLDLYGRLENLSVQNREPPPVYLHCGTEDRLVSQNREMNAFFIEKGFSCTYLESPGKHNWPFWKAASSGVIDFHWKYFRTDQQIQPEVPGRKTP
jgi:S-formylglutathione hydrolase FrmB